MSHLERLVDRFPDLPPSVLLKIDLLRLGARVIDEDVGSRHYHHHDERGQKPQVDARAHLQGSVQLPDGPHVFIAHNPQSPYVMRHGSGGLSLSVDPLMDGHEEPVCELRPGPRFRWTGERTSRGTPLPTLFSPSLGGACGPLAVFLLRHCEFVNDDEECRFCSWVHMGKSFEMRPNALDMREALDAIYREQRSVGYLAFSGGSLYNRTKEADAFLMYMDAVRETGTPLPATVAAIQALDRADSIRLRQRGFDYACYSMEVWDQACWEAVLPGKSRSVGREHWMNCLTEAVDVFGPGRVLCNFVAGVETAVPGVYLIARGGSRLHAGGLSLVLRARHLSQVRRLDCLRRGPLQRPHPGAAGVLRQAGGRPPGDVRAIRGACPGHGLRAVSHAILRGGPGSPRSGSVWNRGRSLVPAGVAAPSGISVSLRDRSRTIR